MNEAPKLMANARKLLPTIEERVLRLADRLCQVRPPYYIERSQWEKLLLEIIVHVCRTRFFMRDHEYLGQGTQLKGR